MKDDLFDSDVEETDENVELEAVEEAEETETDEVEESEETEVEEADETDAEETEETETETVEQTVEKPAEEPEKTVPLAALQSERDKAKQYREQLEKMQTDAANREQARLAQNMPDPIDDPEAYRNFVMASVQQQVQQQAEIQKFQTSYQKAEQEHGKEALDELADWIESYKQTDPTIEQRAMAAPDPVAFAINLRKRTDLLKDVEADPDEWVKRRALEMGLIPTAQPAVAESKPKAVNTGPRSIASAPASKSTNDPSIDSLFD